MDRDAQIHNLFSVLESAVRLVANIDCVSGGIDDWFRKGHHLSYQERWDRFRDIRRKANASWIEHYGELLDKSQEMLDPLTDLYWRIKPQLAPITFCDKSDDMIVQTAELLRAAVRWHNDDGGYWKAFRDAPDHDEAQRNREQIEASDARYPLREKEGREWINHLRDARGLMLLAADNKPATKPERVRAGAAFVAAGHQLSPEQMKRIADGFREVGEHVREAMREANRELDTWNLPPIEDIEDAIRLAESTGRKPDQMTYREIIEWAIEYQKERTIRGFSREESPAVTPINANGNTVAAKPTKGVGFIDVAQFVIDRGWEREIKVASKLAKRWADKEKDRPQSIGLSKRYKSRPIFKVSDALKYLDQFMTLDADERKELRQFLNGVADTPRDEPSESVGNRRKA